MGKLEPTNLKDGKRIAVMHGECWIMPVDKIPKDANFKDSKKYIIGHSETGHHHMLISDKPFQVMPESEKYDLFVRLFEPAKVQHQKTFDIHETQVLAPGDYAIYHKTEYDPFAEVLRAVFD
jgi:hypothetical protein